MKIESINKEVQEKVMQLLNEAPAEKKAEAIMQSIEMIQEAAHEDLVIRLLLRQKEPAMMPTSRSSLDSGIFHRKKRNSMKASRISSSQSRPIRLISFRLKSLTEHLMMSRKHHQSLILSTWHLPMSRSGSLHHIQVQQYGEL